MEYQKAHIFFDTNILECRHSGDALFLSQFAVNSKYFEIEDFIHEMELGDTVEICIPETVWFELQVHLINYFKREKDSMKNKIESFQKSFGDLVEITYEFKEINNEELYSKYVLDIAKNFLDNPRVNAKIIPCPKDEKTMQAIIMQAINSVKPFRTVKANGKEYTDAGLKDALIFNTIIQYIGNDFGVFITNDNDFGSILHDNGIENLKICRTINDAIELLSEVFNIVSEDRILNILKSNDYLKERILSECNFDENMQLEIIDLLSHEKIDDNVEANFTATVGGKKYSFNILYNIKAKELLEVFYDDSEDE